MADAGTKTGEQEQGTGTPAGGSEAAKGGQDSAAIQAAINAVVKREREAAEARTRELSEKITELTTQLADATKGKSKSGEGKTPEVPPEYVESLRKPLVDENRALSERLNARDSATKRSELKRIAAEMAVEGAVDDVADALLARVKILDTGGFEVVDKDGRADYGAKGPKSLNELVLEHLKAKPYLAKASVRSGAGFTEAPRNTSGGDSEIATLRQRIAEHEAKHEFGKAAPLKVQLTDLIGKK